MDFQLTTCSKPPTRVETNGCWKAVLDLVDQLIPSQRDSMRRSFHSQAQLPRMVSMCSNQTLCFTPKNRAVGGDFLCFFFTKKYPHPDFFFWWGYTAKTHQQVDFHRGFESTLCDVHFLRRGTMITSWSWDETQRVHWCSSKNCVFFWVVVMPWTQTSKIRGTFFCFNTVGDLSTTSRVMGQN